MKRIVFIGVLMAIISSCSSNKEFEITEDSIGLISKTTLLSEIETLYAQDSVVVDGASNSIDKIEVYRGQNLLFSLSPKTENPEQIGTVKVEDPRFKIKGSGISLSSTFQEIQSEMEIDKIIPTAMSASIFVKNSPFLFAIDKSNLPESIKYGFDPIEKTQVTENTPIKYFFISWE